MLTMSGIIQKINGIDKRHAAVITFFGLALAVASTALAIYTDFIRTADPKLQIEIIGNEPVLDVREKLPDLEVIYQSQDIAKIGKTLSVVLVRVANRGSANLLGTYYDPNAPITITLDNGTLVRAEITDTSNSYLKSTAKLTSSDTFVTFSPVIIERDEWFTIKLLVLHDLQSKPSPQVSGKVAGQREIAIATTSDTKVQDGFMTNAFGGGLATQLARAPVYVLGSAFLLVSIAFPMTVLGEWWDKRRRRKLVERFKVRTRHAITAGDEFLMDAYQNGDDDDLLELMSMIENPDRLNSRIETATRFLKEAAKEDAQEDSAERRVFGSPPKIFTIAKGLVDSGFVTSVNNEWVVDAERRDIARAFLDYLALMGFSPRRQIVRTEIA